MFSNNRKVTNINMYTFSCNLQLREKKINFSYTEGNKQTLMILIKSSEDSKMQIPEFPLH